MTSRNINKIVQTNINLKPWMLSKNTNKIVDAYVQQIYKQMPASFNKDIRNVKVAAPRPENRGPLSTLRNQQRELPLAKITPRAAAIKMSSSKLKQQKNSLMNSWALSNKNNEQITRKFSSSNLTPSKRVLKTPNYKIYRSLRYGSSNSSSRSSLFKRYDERRRQKQSQPAQLNYLIRSFHTSKFEPTYARFLMPARNQQVESNLGSIPDAIKFSNDMLEDLMQIDKMTKNKLSAGGQKTNPVERCTLEQWHHPPALSKLQIKIPKDSAIKHVSNSNRLRNAKFPPEHREYARLNVRCPAPLKHLKPPNELFTAQHDRNHTELHEKHRRNRMKKLGLIKSPTPSEKEMTDGGECAQVGVEDVQTKLKRTESMWPSPIKRAPQLSNQPKLVEKKPNSAAVPAKNQTCNTTKSCLVTLKKNVTTTKATLPRSNSTSRAFAALPKCYNSSSPIVVARAQMSNKADLRSYRYNRSDFFSTKKY